jgi:NAD(P)-dependent dehydrogenase (short-subunit alcohol dehydrogenase family)
MMVARSRVALVTGAGSGIGLAAASALYRGGYSVVLAGRRIERLRRAIAELGAGPDEALAVACDVSDPASVAGLFGQAQARFARLDVLFNNAGLSAPAIPLEDVSYETWMEVVGANLTGAFLCTQAAFRIMKSQSPRGGRIINNGSISAHAPRPLSAPYTATKHAITGLTKSTALDGRAYDIACGQIDIGNAATEMTAKMQHGMLQPDGSLRPEPRMDVALVGRAVLQMAEMPLDANVLHMTIMATRMPFVGRG